jgi:hypothetical protein
MLGKLHPYILKSIVYMLIRLFHKIICNLIKFLYFKINIFQRGTLSQKERDALAIYNLVPRELDFANVDQVTYSKVIVLLKYVLFRCWCQCLYYEVNYKFLGCISYVEYVDIVIVVLSKAEFTHPVSACVYRIAVQFFITYLDWAKPR